MERRQSAPRPEVASYSAAISASAKGAEWLLPLKLSKVSWHWDQNPNVASYNAAISACEKGVDMCCPRAPGGDVAVGTAPGCEVIQRRHQCV